MRVYLFGILCLFSAGGCGGYYTLTAADQVAPAGERAAVLAHLARNDFFVFNLPVEKALVRFRLPGGRPHGAYTDSDGYAGVRLPLPDRAGRYDLKVSHSDHEGEEVAREVPMFVWEKDAPVLAVDLDSLPLGWSEGKERAVAALNEVSSSGVKILYMSRRDVKDYPRVHKRLGEDGYPDGPIIAWRRKRWRLVKVNRWEFTFYRVVMEDRLESPLERLGERFPNLKTGLSASKLAARAFAAAGLNSLLHQRVNYNAKGVTQIKDWSQVPRVIEGDTP